MVPLAAFRAARMRGASRLILISQRILVMAGASLARASIGARIVTGAAIVAAVMTVGGSQSSWADPPAPIVFAKALGSAEPNVRITNRVEFEARNGAAPIVQVSSVSFSDFESRVVAPIDLRPGTTKASFGPAPMAASRFEPSTALVSVP